MNTSKLDTAIYGIGSHDAAWAFMRACEAAGLMAGYPSLDGFYTVKVAIRTWQERRDADALANGKPVVAYALAGESYPAERSLAERLGVAS